MKAKRCEGKRRQFRGGTFGVFKCGRKATGTVTTQVGFSETHHVCSDEACQAYISSGYPAEYKPFPT
jgi:hypothetical protein